MAYGHVKIYLLQECLANEWNSQKKKKKKKEVEVQNLATLKMPCKHMEAV